ncbi:hypothetical protein T492DRAFT_920559 [Pavlovales sp. CCMP2436]|nr:hypothetical protein T492DRAFT_920559 [Pavlovales sp. CCMP2436]
MAPAPVAPAPLASTIEIEDPASRRRTRRIGLSLGVFGTLAVAADGLLLKLAFASGASAAVAVIYKYFAAAATMVLFLTAAHMRDRLVKGSGKGLEPFLPVPSRLGVKYIVMSAGLNIILEVRNFSVANVLAFASLAPVWTTLFSWPALKTIPPRRTLVACVFALAGSVVIGLGFGLAGSADQSQTETFRALGLSFAVGTGISAAAQFTLIQKAALRAPETNMLVAHGFGVALAGAVGFALLPSPIFHPPGTPLYPGQAATGYLVACGIVCSALAISALTLACRFIPATEVSLLLQIEGILGPVSTFLALGEVPSTYTLAGGVLVIFVVAVHEALAFREEMRASHE